MSHTPEPWFFVRGMIYSHTQLGDGNARRIVACVNACQGFETEELEQLVKDGDTLKTLIASFAGKMK